MLDATLVGARLLSSNVRELTFEAGPGFSFQPGQWVNIHIPGHYNEKGELLKRSFSIASAPASSGRFDLAVAHGKGGHVSALLNTAKIGEHFAMTGPFGAFLMAPIERPFLMVATGSGVAPFRSMLQASAMQARNFMALLFGARDESELLYQSEFLNLERENPRFRFYPTLSRPGSNWAGREGYVQVHLADVAALLGKGNLDVYICGQPGMVKEVRRIVHEQVGVELSHIHVERY